MLYLNVIAFSRCVAPSGSFQIECNDKLWQWTHNRPIRMCVLMNIRSIKKMQFQGHLIKLLIDGAKNHIPNAIKPPLNSSQRDSCERKKKWNKLSIHFRMHKVVPSTCNLPLLVCRVFFFWYDDALEFEFLWAHNYVIWIPMGHSNNPT